MAEANGSLPVYVRKVAALGDEDKLRILNALAASDYYFPELGNEGYQLLQGAPQWTNVRAVSGMEITKQAPVAPEKTSRFRAAGIVKASVKDVKEFVLNQELAPKYDPLFKHGQWLQLFHDDSTGVFKGFNHGVLGMSGLSAVCWDRDYVVLAVGMDLPNGGFVVHMSSLDEGHAKAVAPNPANHVLRGRIAQSSWVACPLQDGTTHVTNILQCDLKGFVTGMYGRTMGTSIKRIEKEIGAMPSAMLESYRRKRKMLWDRTMRHPPHAQTRTSSSSGQPHISPSFGAVHPVEGVAEEQQSAAAAAAETTPATPSAHPARIRRTFSMFNRKSANAVA